MRISCGLAHTMFANEFGAEMCRQPGMLCDAPDTDWRSVAAAAVAIGIGKDGSRGINGKPAANAGARLGWSTGDDIYALTKAGTKPAWLTVRGRFWKNEAANPQIDSWSAANLDRMSRGVAPQRYNRAKGGMESMELSHEPIQYRHGGTAVIPRWPQDHAAVDPYRFPGYGP